MSSVFQFVSVYLYVVSLLFQYVNGIRYFEMFRACRFFPSPFERHVSIRDQSNEGNAMRIQPRPPSTYFPVCIEFPTGADESVELCGVGEGRGRVEGRGGSSGTLATFVPSTLGRTTTPPDSPSPRQPVLDPIPPQTTRKEMSCELIRYRCASGISFQLHAR